MKYVFYHCVLFAFVCTTLFSCKKQAGGTTKSPAGTTVYVAGNNGTNPVLWQNGVPSTLSTTRGWAGQVTVSGGDVYVAGVDAESNLTTPGGPSGQFVYWKNDSQQTISGIGLQVGSSSIAVANGNVYYANGQAWGNGAVTALQGLRGGRVQATFANGSDVYFTGADSVGDAVYWKNGVLNVVAKGYYPTYNAGSDPDAACLYVSGNDVYVGGLDSSNNGTYWKNGSAVVLNPASNVNYVAGVHAIFVQGGDVYAVAYLIVPTNGGTNAPAYWKNGVEYDLPLNGAAYGNATAIFVQGQDVYVAGQTSNGAVYWKNGVQTVLSATAGSGANGIYVQ